MKNFILEKSWSEVLKNELENPYMQDLALFVENERKNKTVYPAENLVFNAFFKTPYKEVKVVIMGQDPYHNPLQAHGLSFSVPDGVKLPPSLKNIFKELKNDLNIDNKSGCLDSWASQGVLLLNATLTVTEKTPMSHHGRGWEQFTDAVVASLVEREDPVIFVLWGNAAKKKVQHIENHTKHVLLTAAHPSPFSAHSGFFGCQHFSRINEILSKLGQKEIDWTVHNKF